MAKMTKEDFNNNFNMLDDIDLEEIARCIKEEGYTSGHLCNENGKRIYWELDVNVWRD